MIFRRRRRTPRDLADEIASHLAHEADELQEHGRGGTDFEGMARRSFGNVTSVEEAIYERRRWLFWDHLSRDVRQAARLIWRRPAFSLVVIAILAVGLGANTAVFSVVDAVLLRPLPYRDAGRLAMLWQEDAAHELHEGHVSLLNFSDWKSRARTFADMTLFGPQTFLLGNNSGPPERMRSARVQANFFPLLGVNPILGRVFSKAEEKRGEPVVVLSYRLWQSRFGGSPQALGADLQMDRRPHRIIGVMPASFQYPFADTQVWELMTAHPYWAARDRNSSRSNSAWFALARLRSGATWPEAQAEMRGIARQLANEHPEDRAMPEIRVVPLYAQTTAAAQLPLAVLSAAVFLMLLIACINVANLMFANGSAREREFSVRRALGASRARVAAQLLTESLLLSLAATPFGLALSIAATKAMIAFGPREIPRLAEARVDFRVLLFALALCVLTTLAAGLWPALETSTTSARSRQWRTAANRRVRNFLVIGEFSIALVLVAAAGLMIRSFLRLESVNPGFRPDKLLIMRVDLHVGRTAAQYAEYFREAIARAQSLPGVRSAGAISGFLRSDPEDAVEIEGRPPQRPGPCDDLIEGAYFATAGIPLERGRLFTDQDRAGSLPVAIINAAMARAYWPGEDPIGKRFRFSSHPWHPWLTVVGVTGDMRRQGLEKEAVPQEFRPNAQEAEDMLDIIVRTSVDPAAIAP
ncbi:MAG TPA: ABC transporter permease, partial [Bryobacteraceae bacterium]|nr:ABC transporter permease [Bryobacteraceae bacterium]